MNAKDAGPSAGRAASLEGEMSRLADIGLEPSEVDLRTYFGRPEGLEELLRGLDLLWVRGGNSFVLRRAFSLSGADTVVTQLLREDTLVFGGFSAAVALLTPSLRGLDLVDDPSVVPEGYAAPLIWDGLNLLSYAVAPHYRSDHPESAGVETIVQHFIDNHILFRALRDGEAIVVDGLREEFVR